MRAIIDGKRYDTETATELGGIGSATCHQGDFEWWTATLYKTKSGAFFMSGEGGARSPFARSYESNSVSGGEGIRALSVEQALEYAERDLPAETIEAHFEVKDA